MFAWVIERDGAGGRLEYWSGTKGWNLDNLDAVRFARQVDADAVAPLVGEAWGRVREHGWSP